MLNNVRPDEQNRPRILTVEHCVKNAPWRIGIPFRELARQGHEIRMITEDQIGDQSPGDILVLHNPSKAWVANMVEKARQNNIRFVVDSDDLLTLEQLPEHAHFAQHWHPLRHKHEAKERVRAGISPEIEIDTAPRNDAISLLHDYMREADAVTVSTDVLASAYKHLNPNIHILPNCYDDTHPLWNLPRPARPTINIGFLGTEHHGPNLDLLRGAIEPLLEEFPDVRVVEAGQGGLIERLQAQPERLVHLGWFPFETFPLVLHQMDIVLAPLTDEPFMVAKSNIRCMTAGLVSAPVIASPVGPYAGYVEHGVNGYFASSPEEWTTCLRRLIADPFLRNRMGQRNQETAHTFAMSKNFKRWETVYAAI